MKESGKGQQVARISDEAVRAKTGKTWQQWFGILDKAGAKKMNHTQIATYLYDELGVPEWWCQMVAVGYEQARGLRELHERAGGYEISVSKTMGTSVSKLYKAWLDEKTRRRWLPKTQIVIRKASPGKSMRITWADRKTNLDVNFYPKGASRCHVVVQHTKLADAKEAARMKDYWGKTLDGLREMMEG